MMLYAKILAAVVLLIGAFTFGQRTERNAIEAEDARLERVAKVAREESQKVSAEAIAGIEINHTTIQGRLEREIRVETQYRDCRHSPDAFRLLNDALDNRAPSDSVGTSELPKEIGETR